MSKMNRHMVRQQETLANAAPELLEALENIIKAYTEGYEIVPNILAVRKAIAKAKGV